MLPGLTFRQDYYSDPKAWVALVDLLRDTFGIDVGLQMNMGGYDPSCMPFGWFDQDGVLVANLSAFTMPMRINGKTYTAAAFQSGAVRPPYQGRGLYRDVMRKAFDWSDQQDFDFGILLTDKPAMYEPYGFQIVPQTVFAGEIENLGSPKGKLRTLSIENVDDLELIQHKLEGRTPVSNAFAVCGQAEMFTLNKAFDPSIRLSFLEALDVIVADRTTDDGQWHLLDIVGGSIPDLQSILCELATDAKTVKVFFPPDMMSAELTPEPYQGTCALMIKGDIVDQLLPGAMLSPMAEF